jgi:hypothetical protein
MRFTNFLSRKFSAINRNNHLFSKLTKEDKMEYFVYYPAIVGGCCGAKTGWDSGFDMTKDAHYFLNIPVTAVCMLYGTFCGAVYGAIWPVSLPILISRQFIDRKSTDDYTNLVITGP